jgi:hypothetical protein
MAKLTDRTELTAAADDDWLHVVDKSDATDGAGGTSKKIQKSNLVQRASSAETTAGTSTTKAVTPGGFRASEFGYRTPEIMVLNSSTALTVTDELGGYQFMVPSWMNGWNLVDVEIGVTTVSSSGTPTFQIHNITQSVDMLSTAVTIDANEKTSIDPAVPHVIDTANDGVAAGDFIRIDCDVAGTGTQGCIVVLVFQKPGA